jgi:hypothetical protein
MENGRLKIIDNYKEQVSKGERLKYGTIVHCKGDNGTSSFYGIVYEYGVLELECGSNAYINTKEPICLGKMYNYWTIDRVCKNPKLIIEED